MLLSRKIFLLLLLKHRHIEPLKSNLINLYSGLKSGKVRVYWLVGIFVVYYYIKFCKDFIYTWHVGMFKILKFWKSAWLLVLKGIIGL